MKIMVAFLGNKKKKSNRSFDGKSIDKGEKKFIGINSLSSLNSKNYIKERIMNNKKIDVNRVRKNSLKNTKETSKIIQNMYKGNSIYASVVSNDNIVFKNFKKKIDKEKARTNIEDILNNRQSSSKIKFKNIKEDYRFEKSNFKASNLINFMLVSLPLLIILFTNSTLARNILVKFSTNFRQAENLNFELADLVKTYGLYNTNNYIINEEIPPKVEKAEETEVIVTSDEEIIDIEAKIEDVAAFLEDNTVNVEITENSSTIQRVTVGSTKILNYSSKRDIDYAGLLSTDVILTKKSDKILLYNTHTSESYTNSEGYKFEYTGTMRTTDAQYNMLAIAKKFSENLKLKGFESVQDTTPHDYGTYTSAYAKSRITVKNALQTMSGAGIIIDVHRDASSNLAYRPVVNIKGVQVAQLMFVVGVGSSSSPNNNWQDNLKLALKLQQMADKVYPGLFRPMIIRNSVYNQDLNKYSLLIEFGATGNTIEEVKLSTRCITNLLNLMYKD